MAVITQQYINAIHQYEGGVSSDPRDISAAKNPSACGMKDGHPIHTNKGVTWAAFVKQAPTLGYTADCATFMAMPDDVWIKIFKYGYWNPVQLDDVNSNGTAYLLADFSWGSGTGYVRPFLKNFLSTNYNINASDTTSQNKALNTLTAQNEQDVIQKLSDARLASLKTMKDKTTGALLFTTYGGGWTSRLNGLTELAQSMAGKAVQAIKTELKGDLSAGAYEDVREAYHFTKRNWLPIVVIGVGAVGLLITLAMMSKKKVLTLPS